MKLPKQVTGIDRKVGGVKAPANAAGVAPAVSDDLCTNFGVCGG